MNSNSDDEDGYFDEDEAAVDVDDDKE